MRLKNYVLSRLLDVNLWEGITIVTVPDVGPYLENPAAITEVHTPDLLHFQDQVADYR